MILSLITICRNNASQIEKTLNSVLSQKTAGVEYIVIDGGSTDGTVEIIQRHGATIDRWVSEPDRGIYDAINKGIRLATGQHIGLVHGGDLLLPGVVKTLLTTIPDHSEEILYGGIQTSRDGRFVGAYGYEYHRLDQEMIPHPGTFVPRRVYDKFGLYDTSYKIAADYKAFLTFYHGGVPFHWLGILVADFDLTGVSSGSTLVYDEMARARRECGIIDEKTRWGTFKDRLKTLRSALKDLFAR